MEKVKFNIKVFDNFIEITPIDGVKDNSVYEIRFKDLKEENGHKTLDAETVRFCTKMTPAYTSLESVKALVENCSIPEETILYHIREASKYADYIKKCKASYGKPVVNIDPDIEKFQKEQFAKYKAAYECILRFYMDKAAEFGLKGALGDISFDTNINLPDISKLLETLKKEVDEWELALQGHTNIRAGIRTGVKASTSSSYNASTKASAPPEFSRRSYT